MEEKFSVSLELMIEKFKNKAKQAQDIAKNVSNKIKENMSPEIGKNAFSGMTAESELLLNKINDIKASLEMAKGDSNLFSKTDILEMRSELEKLEKQYNKNNQSGNMFNNSLNKIQDNMKKNLNNAKRFTMSLFGIQSAYRVVSRAMSAYSSIDDESAKKTQAAWIGLGSMFAWLKDIIADFTIKAVSYINVFVRAMTGVDFLAKAMKKSMDKASKSATKLSKILAGFDEITNLDDSAGGASVDTSWIDAFKNVQLDPSITDFFQKLGEAMKPVYNMVKNIFDNWEKYDDYIYAVGGTLFAVFIGAKIGSVLTNIGLVSTSLGGLIGLSAVTVTLAIVGWKNVYNKIEELKNSLKNVKEMYEDLTGKAKTLAEESLKKLKNNELTNEQLKNSIDYHIRLIEKNQEINEEMENEYGWVEGINKANEERNKQNDIAIQYLKEINDLGLLDEENKKRLIELIAKQKVKYEELADQTNISKEKQEEYNRKTEELRTELEKLVGKDYSTSIEIKAKANLKEAEKDYSNFFSNLGKTLGSIVNPFEWGNIGKNIKNLFSGGGYAKGLDYVPVEGLYHLHQGETVVPAGFTPEMHGLGKTDNKEVINKLDELIYELRIKDMNAYIVDSEIGSASQKYRNFQSRVMGEELS